MAARLNHKSQKINQIMVLFAFTLIVAVLAGCKSPKPNPPEPPVVPGGEDYTPPVELNPIALLSDDSSIYARLPAQEHLGLTQAILMEMIPNLQAKDASFMSNYLDVVWMGEGTVEDRSRMELVVTGTVPSIALKAALTEKNGWSKEFYAAPTTNKLRSLGYKNEFDYYAHCESPYQVSLFVKNLLGVSQNLKPLFDKCAVHPVLAEIPRNQWISKESDDVLFFITRPGQYLRNMLGAKPLASIDYVYGKLHYLSGEDYYLTIDMHITNPKSIASLKSMLSIAFGLTGGTVKQIDEETVQVADIPYTQQQIVDVVTRDPITGKHYSVINDEVIEEDE